MAKIAWRTVRAFKTKSKNAQEAHEAIRPTSFSFPRKLKPFLNGGTK